MWTPRIPGQGGLDVWQAHALNAQDERNALIAGDTSITESVLYAENMTLKHCLISQDDRIKGLLERIDYLELQLRGFQ